MTRDASARVRARAVARGSRPEARGRGVTDGSCSVMKPWIVATDRVGTRDRPGRDDEVGWMSGATVDTRARTS
jgi:hypothetical protein